jgi:ribose transport system substrate-binding protein
MKRRLFLLPALALVALLAVPHSAPAQQKHYRVGVSFYSQLIPLYVEMRKGMEEEAGKRGVQLQFTYSGNDAQQQSNQIANFVTQHVDLILCSPVDSAGLVLAYQQARKAGIPVISVANKVPDKDEDAFVGVDLEKAGEMEMGAAIQALHGKGTAALIEGPPQIAFVQQWKSGVQKALSKAPGVKIVADLNGGLTQNDGLTEANNILTAHPDVKAIVAVSDQTALGAAQALKERSIPAGKVWLSGWDGYPEVVDQIKNGGYIQYTIANRPFTWGQIAVDVAADWLAGKKPKQHIVRTPILAIDRANASKLTVADYR